MRPFKIVEMKDGNGNKKFKVMARYGWGIFSMWEQQSGTISSMKAAQEKVEECIKEYKDGQRIKIKEYVYTTVPNHVPEEQVGRFMEINVGKKKC